MSFQFPTPIPGSTNTSSYSAYHEFDIYDEIHAKLMRCSGPDYDELVIPLSLYAFNRLSPSDQQEQLVEISSHHEETDFTELFKKLNYSDQVKFLSQVLQKLKIQRLLPSFKQLDAEHQHQVIQQLAHFDYSSLYLNLLGDPEAEIILPDSEETEDFSLRRFTQLCNGHMQDAHKIIEAWISGGDQPAEETSESDDLKLCFSDFFVGFASIWFQGQFASGQEMLIEQLSEGVEGDLIEKCMQKESEEDFKLRKFTELCTKVLDFRVQEKFLDNVEKKLNTYKGWSLEPQDHKGAVKLFCDLSTLGFSKLSAELQYQMIEEMSNQVQSKVLKTKRVRRRVKRHFAAEDLQTRSTDPEEEAIRIGRFRELFNQVSDLNRIDLFRELRISLKHKQYFEAVQIFCGLGTKDQEEMTKKMADTIRSSDHGTIGFHKSSQREEEFVKSSVESMEDMRVRRFKKVCVDYLSIRDDTLRTEAADKYCRVRQEASQDSEHNEEESPNYAEFLIDASIFWFKARCANLRRNPLHIMLSGEVEDIEKLPEESEDDYRLRRFTESFMRLPLDSKERFFNWIQDGIIADLGCFKGGFRFQSYTEPSEGRDSFASEWIKMKLPDLQRQGAAATTTIPPVVSAAAAGSATTTTRWTLFKRFFK